MVHFHCCPLCWSLWDRGADPVSAAEEGQDLPCGAVMAASEQSPLMIQIDSLGLTVGEKFTLQIKSDDRCSSQEYTEQLNYVEHKFKQYL